MNIITWILLGIALFGICMIFVVRSQRRLLEKQNKQRSAHIATKNHQSTA